ncbi:MAG: MBOAT family O-acyltransferase [Candidatus Omnitrophota bacterium]
MVFNSLQFALFFAVVYSLYLALKHKNQNRMLLVASYVFYGTWDWRFLSLIWISTILDYFCGLAIDRTNDPGKRKIFLILSVSGNLLILFFFKYFNFFAESLQELLGGFGITAHTNFLHIILPVGISFYTFQTMSYTIDIYKREMKATRKFLDFALFVAFFPQLVAGPIERASHLLPQILNKRNLTLEKFYDGAYLIFWGLFQKVFVADNLASIVDPVFNSNPPYNGVSVMLALYAFAFQIYCDFAGYSNIARGLGKCMGFDIMVNFNLPYFALNPSDFWKRWHISLSSFLRDYLYIPLGGNRGGTLRTYRNLVITMLLGGLWHGAAWTFVLWGAYQGVLLILHRVLLPFLGRIPSPRNVLIDKLWKLARIIFFFQLTCLGWLIFRARSVKQIFEMLKAVACDLRFAPGMGFKVTLERIVLFIGVLIVVQILQYRKKDLMIIPRLNPAAAAFCYFVFFYLMLIFGVTGGKEFIYFQF